MNFNEGYFKTLNFVRSVELMYMKQLEMFCTKSGFNELQKENIIKALMKNKEIFTDEKKIFCASKADFKISNFTAKLEKTIWFYIHNLDKYDFANFNPKLPASGYFCGNKDGEYQELTVFYIPQGTEKTESRIIETNYGRMPTKVPTGIICSEISSLESVYLSENFDIKSIAVIDDKGDIKVLK